jgi:ribonuclease P protein component
VAVTRLKRRAEFLRVAAARRKWAAPGLVLQVAPTGSPAKGDAGGNAEAAFRVGFTVSKKVGNAVARNRARRRLRAAAEQVLARHAAQGNDYVLIGRQETVTRPFPLLLKDLETALKRMGAWQADGGHSKGESA